jgi:hypothetical protein
MNRFFPLLGLVSLSVACGGRLGIEEPADSAITDTGTSSETTIPDSITVDGRPDVVPETPGDAPIDSPPPTPATCDAIVAAVCGPDTAPCCTKHGFTWGESGCKSVMSGYCGGQVDAVKAGTMTYDASYLDACAKSWVSELKTCDMDFITYIKSTFACAQLFNGTKAPGDACDPTLYECKAPKGGAAWCDQAAKRCRVYTVVPKGGGCNYYGSTIRYCDSGLYCDLTSPTSTCLDALKTGEACAGPDDLACGLDNVCKDNKCAPGLPKDALCGSNPECASYQCTAGKCTDPNVTIVSKWICGSP